MGSQSMKLLTSVTFNFRYQNHATLICMNNFNSSWFPLKKHFTKESLKLPEFKNKVEFKLFKHCTVQLCYKYVIDVVISYVYGQV